MLMESMKVKKINFLNPILIQIIVKGELLRDKRNNVGTLTYLNGDVFTGKWLED